MKRLKKISTWILCIGMLFALSVNVQAAQNYKKIYRDFLKERNVSVSKYSFHDTVEMNYFILLDINGDGKKELITAPDRYFNSIVYVFYIKNGKVKYAGHSLNKYHGDKIAYSTRYKGLVLENGGSGAAGNSIYQLKKGRLKEKYSYQMQSVAQGNLYFINNKQVSESTFYAKKNKYFAKNTIKSYTMYYNNAKNRKKRIK